MSAISPVSPTQHRDIRSASQPFKRDKDHGEKWSQGTRPSPGVHVNWNVMGEEVTVSGSDSQKEKVRPMKWKNAGPEKSHANKSPKPTVNSVYDAGAAHNRVVRKVDAMLESNDHTDSPLSKSLLELLPQHVNNTNSSIQTAIRDQDTGILYSYDKNITSPGEKGRRVDLGGLVEQAEKKWVAEQTERIVKGEYEVLDEQGETTFLPSGKGKKRGSPKQKAVKTMPAVVKDVVVDEDGFELI